MHFVYYAFVMITCIGILSEIEDIAYTEFNELILEQVHLGKLNVVDSRIDEWQDMLEEMLGVVSAPADNTLCMSGMASCDGSRGIGAREAGEAMASLILEICYTLFWSPHLT